MENLTLLNSLLVLAGVFTHIAMSLKTEVYEGKEPFSFKHFWRRNRVDMIVGIITGFVSLILAEPLVETLGLYGGDSAPFFHFHAFFSGVLGRGWVFAMVRRLKIDKNEQQE